MLICQVAKEKYLVDRIIARVNNPRNRQHFELLGVKPYVSATDLILRLLEHEVPGYGLVHLLDLPEERLEIIEMLARRGLPGRRQARRRPRDARGQPADLGAARGPGVRADPRHGARGRRRGARRARPGPRGGAEDLLRAGRRRRTSPQPGSTDRGRSQGRVPADRRRDGLRQLRRGAAQARGGGRRSCWSGASPSRRTSARRSRRSTCAGEAKREDAYVNPPEWYEENGVELRDGTNVMSLDAEARTAKLQGGDEVELREGADRHRRQRQHPPGRGRRARRDPLPARVRQLGHDPRGRRGRRARRADRRQLHRLRGGGVADGEGHRLRDRDDGGHGALADLRRRGRRLLPAGARVEGGRDPRRRDAARRSRERTASRRWSPRAGRRSRATSSSSAPG